MLGRGLKLLEEETARLGASQALPGEVAFKLYDTFGFPLDLTQDILRGQGRGVDNAGFDAAMARQRAAARKAWSGSGEAATETLRSEEQTSELQSLMRIPYAGFCLKKKNNPTHK